MLVLGRLWAPSIARVSPLRTERMPSAAGPACTPGVTQVVHIGEPVADHLGGVPRCRGERPDGEEIDDENEENDDENDGAAAAAARVVVAKLPVIDRRVGLEKAGVSRSASCEHAGGRR